MPDFAAIERLRELAATRAVLVERSGLFTQTVRSFAEPHRSGSFLLKERNSYLFNELTIELSWPCVHGVETKKGIKISTENTRVTALWVSGMFQEKESATLPADSRTN